MQLIDSKKKQLQYPEFIRTYYEEAFPDDKSLEGFAKWAAPVAKVLTMPGVHGGMFGNTFIFYKRGEGKDNYVAVLWAFNLDSMSNLPENIHKATEKIGKEGVTDFVITVDSPAVVRAIRSAFRRYKDKDDKLDISEKDGKYTAHYHIGKQRHG